MRRSKSDEMILSYKDVILRRSDLHILSGPYFLNDRVLEFYFSHLLSLYPSDDILLLPPSIAFWIGSCLDKESLIPFVEPLNLASKKLVLFPVNDNMDVSLAEGGSHWSLLAFEREANVFIHHDSHSALNAAHAQRLYDSVVGLMGTVSKPRYVEYSRSPQQVNGYDCGLFVCAIARAICCWYVSRGSRDSDEDGLWLSAVMEQVTPSSIAELRTEILGLITSLIAADRSA
ncbi:hypothetical protein Dimus_019575 [Dionaea muscipula]